MTDFVLRCADARVLLWHMAAYGLAAILESEGIAGVGLVWTATMQPQPGISGEGVSAAVVDEIVRGHAQAHVGDDTWVSADVELRGSMRGLMSPRLTPFDDDVVWQRVQAGRHAELDRLTNARSWLDLRMLAALGEPCYWSKNQQDVTLQDDAASRFEMQPRNQGSELVGSRLRKLAQAVAARDTGMVAAGLAGEIRVDEIGGDRPDSRTATGLDAPGPTDNAVAWCALWGISQFPVVPQVSVGPRAARRSRTTGHIGQNRNEWFYVPMWHSVWRLAKLRSVLAANALSDAAAVGLPRQWAPDDVRAAAARSWLDSLGVAGIARFAVERFGSDSAPERRAMLGEFVPIKVE